MSKVSIDTRLISSAVLKSLMKGASQVLLISHPMEATIAGEAIDLGSEILRRRFQLTSGDIHQKIHTWCREIMPAEHEKYLEILCAAAEICLENLNLFEQGFNAAQAAADLGKNYIQRYHTQFSTTDLHHLERYLPPVLEKTISELVIASEQDPDFQVAWKAWMLQRIDHLEREQLSHRKELDEQKQLVKNRVLTCEKLSSIAELSESYLRKWEESLFLNDTVPLKQVYQLPNIENKHESMKEVLQNFIPTTDVSWDAPDMLVVLGHPGSGKSTLITYLLNKCKLSKRITVRVHRFTAFENINWNGNPQNLPQLMLNAMGLDINHLTNLLLILDGLDEINMLGGHDAFLDHLYDQWILRDTTYRFSLIITCRTNRIQDPEILSANYIMLSPLTGQQIQQFARAYWKGTNMPVNTKMMDLFKELDHHKHSLKDILGIPLILYITLALEVDVTDSVSLSDVYSQIFSLDHDNSIYLRSRYDQMHSVTAEEAEKIHEFSKKIAEKIWELNPTEAAVEKSVYEPLAANLAGRGENRLRKLLIGQYFMEGQGSAQLLFVHRSLYEYFTALSIFDSVKSLAEAKQLPTQMYSQLQKNGRVPALTAVANLIGVHCLFDYPDIQGHLLNMLRKSPIKSVHWWQKLFSLFTQYGMVDAVVGRTTGGTAGIQEELNRFYNLIWLVREELKLLKAPSPFDLGNLMPTPIYFRIPSKGIKDLSYLNLPEIELSGGDFGSGDFSRSNMERAHLIGTILSAAQLAGTQLRLAVLCHADLSGANLRKADLSKADLQNADLSGANLQDANLAGANLKGANLKGANLQNANLAEAVLENVNFTNAVFCRANLSKAKLHQAVLRNLNFSYADLCGADLTYADMSYSDLYNADLTKADLTYTKLDYADIREGILDSANMQHTSLTEAYLCSASLQHISLQKADLTGADLRKAHLLHTDLREADLSNACLQFAVLHHVDLRDAEMIYADFGGASIKRATMTLGGIDKSIYSDKDFCTWDITWDEPAWLKMKWLPFDEVETLLPCDLDMMRFHFRWEVRQIL